MPDDACNSAASGETYDAVVIGAGPSGSLAALLLARAGHRVMQVERQRFPRAKVCGCCLNQRAQQLLDRAGLLQGLRSLRACPTDRLRLHSSGRRLSISMPGGLAISRRAMDQWLAETAAAAGVQFVDECTAEVLPEECDSNAATQHQFPAVRRIRIESSTGSRVISAKVVLVCDGLGHPSVAGLPGFQSAPRADARIGLGAVLTTAESANWLASGDILMAAATGGYCGAVRTEDGSVNLAAAVDPAAIQSAGGPRQCLQQIFRESGVQVPQELETVSLRGTVPLTRRSLRITGPRLLLLGDAAGYVEPFTGEGMAWGLTAATLAAPLASSGIRAGWTTALQRQYERQLRTAVVSEQTVCRTLSWILSRPRVLQLTVSAAALLPAVAGMLVRRVNRIPISLESRR